MFTLFTEQKNRVVKKDFSKQRCIDKLFKKNADRVKRRGEKDG